jgi:hypothetical protein
LVKHTVETGHWRRECNVDKAMGGAGFSPKMSA